MIVLNENSVLNKLKNHTPIILGSEAFKKYAVLVPLVEINGETHILFEVRSLEMRRQPGDICFPGGRKDPLDLTEQQTAIRETTEELGIKEENITDVMPLNYIVSPGMIVYPYAGVIDPAVPMKLNHAEVGGVFTVPLTYFLDNPPAIYPVNLRAEPEENFPFELVVGGENYHWQTRKVDEYFYSYKGRVIWGMTARILAHLVDIIR